jgi:hypothetical protein
LVRTSRKVSRTRKIRIGGPPSVVTTAPDQTYPRRLMPHV